MRILKVHNYYVQPGGEDTVFHAEVELLRSYGHEVITYVEDNKKIEQMNKAIVALQTVWSFSSYRKIKQILEDERPSVVHFHNTFPLISPAAYYACRELRIPVVQTLDNQRLICPSANFFGTGNFAWKCLGTNIPWPGVLHACYHNSRLHTGVVASMVSIHRWLKTWQQMVDIFLCSTNFYKDLFIQSGFPSEKIVVMPHYVRQLPYVSAKDKSGEYALFVGRLDPEKGVETLLEAWRLLKIPLKIRGDGQLTLQAKQFVELHHLNHVEFVGRLSEEELSDLINKARFLIVPSGGYYETFGMVIVEAYSKGVPVVASNLGVTSEIVSDKYTGLLFESGNPRDLADKAAWMWDHTTEADTMGRNGLEFFENYYTDKRCYHTLIKVYDELIESR
ncbi:MAG: glycosyltransferase family 4 protein [Anaerolineales bacterium]|nr:glycosyltransferase family 4 protein [Anaerolineales bacterium]